jgi:hypothetical protein
MEDLPKTLLCIPLVAHWLWLALRHRSLTLPSAINPRIETGGLAGETKSACLAQIAPAFAHLVAAWHCVTPDDDALAVRAASDLAYPLIAKPEIGWCGYGVRLIRDDAALAAYARAFPPGATFIIQHYVAAPNEAGLAYLRGADARTGTLTAMTLRHAPRVTGDGRHSLAWLIASDPATSRHAARLAASCGKNACARVPEAGEDVALTIVASLRAGAQYEDASAAITPSLSSIVDAIACSMPEFHAGRFDVRFDSLAALQAGMFHIIEVNGAGAEAIEYWDPALSMRAAFAGVFAKQRVLFSLGAAMRALGHRPVGPRALARAWLMQQRLIAGYP